MTGLVGRVLRRVGGAGLRSGPSNQDLVAAERGPCEGELAEPEEQVAHCWPLGHFYSPVPDTVALARKPTHSRVWPCEPRELLGIDWRDAEQVEFVTEVLARQEPLALPNGSTGDPRDFHLDNEMFDRVDAWLLQGVLRHFQPRRMVEVGCGWSSLLSARINREHLGGRLDLTCIEPFPPDFLPVEGIERLLVSAVQDVGLEPFLGLGDRDVLFVDSAHVAKTGGDVVHIFQEVLPRLAPGVVVHFHDIFLPRDYPEDWVMAGRSWNEQYILRAFLTHNTQWEVLASAAWLSLDRPDVLRAVIPDVDLPREGGASLWLRRR